MNLLIIYLIIWCVSGPIGFIYWWTKEYDLKYFELLMALACVILGSITWIVGFAIHGNKSKILFKKCG